MFGNRGSSMLCPECISHMIELISDEHIEVYQCRLCHILAIKNIEIAEDVRLYRPADE
jgi:hypothetical protein